MTNTLICLGSINQQHQLGLTALSLSPAALNTYDEFLLPEQLPTAYEDKFPLLIQSDATVKKIALLLKTGRLLSATITLSNKLEDLIFREHQVEVIEFGDSYEAPTTDAATGSASEGTATKKGRIVALTIEDMQKRKNDVKARTTLLLALPDEHQLRFSKYKTAQELWAGGSETLEQTFNRLHATISHLQFMNIEIEQDHLNRKFLTSLAPEWLMHTIVWRNRSDLDTMSLDDLYNHLKTGKNISIQGTDVAGFDKSKVECFNYHKIGHFARECRAPRSQDRGRRDNYKHGSKVEEHALKELMVIDGVGWDWSFMANEEDDHSLVADEEALTEFALMAKTNAESEVFDNSLCLKNCKKNTESLNSKITDLTDKLYDSKNMLFHYKAGLSQVEGLLVFADDTINDYTRPSPNVESNPNDLQNSSSSASENRESTGGILSKPEIKFVRPADSPTVVKTDKKETARKSTIKYAELYRKPSKKSTVRGNQRNWNNLKSQWLGKNFVMKKACYNYGGVDHPCYNCGKWVDHGRSWAKNNNTYKSMSPRPAIHRPYRPPMRPVRPNMNVAQPKRTYFHKLAHSYNKRPFQRTSAVRSQFRAPRVPTVTRKFPTVNRKFLTVNRKFPTGNTKFSTADLGNKGIAGNSQNHIDDKGYWDSGCSRHMTGNISYLTNYEPYDGGYVSFGQGGCKITGKGTIKIEPKKFSNALQDPSSVEAMQEELLQFKIQNVWSLVDCLKGEEGIDYDEVFAPVTRIEAIRLFLAYASFMGFTVYQIYVKSAFFYDTIDEEVYVM
uniref:Uncharacterized protein n=1 Tax=Tanacetum cinerariifolium TaxID=118510 RepID=A0A6L2N106_TANCI|nr:hypothetical protein [Tanacetum cinerariifolium]